MLKPRLKQRLDVLTTDGRKMCNALCKALCNALCKALCNALCKALFRPIRVELNIGSATSTLKRTPRWKNLQII